MQSGLGPLTRSLILLNCFCIDSPIKCSQNRPKHTRKNKNLTKNDMSMDSYHPSHAGCRTLSLLSHSLFVCISVCVCVSKLTTASCVRAVVHGSSTWPGADDTNVVMSIATSHHWLLRFLVIVLHTVPTKPCRQDGFRTVAQMRGGGRV